MKSVRPAWLQLWVLWWRGVGLGLGLLLGAGCTQQTAELNVQLVTKSCSSPGPFDGVTHVRVILTGDGMKTLDQTTTVNQHALKVQNIPPGLNRRLEVRGYIQDPSAGGRVFSVGRSGRFTVSDLATLKGDAVPTVTIIMRPVNVFVAPSTVGDTVTCSKLLVPRAGHTASLLADGRVLLLGGFGLDAVGARSSVGSAELFDPLKGTFIAGPGLPGVEGPRAFHTASPLLNGGLFIAGGERTDGGETAQLSSAFVFHPDTGAYDGVQLSVARSRAGVGSFAGGNALLVGGVGSDGLPVDTLEWFQVDAGFTHVLTERLGVWNVAVHGLPDGGGVVAAGGTDGGALVSEIRFFPVQGAGLGTSSTIPLPQPEEDGVLVPFGAGLLLAGGFTADPADLTVLTGLATTELLTTASATTLQRAEGPAVQPRGDACAVVVGDGQVLVAGGLETDLGPETSAPSAELVTTAPSGAPASLGMPNLPQPRFAHACVGLPDGSALVTGGVDNSSGTEVVLQDAYVFMPAPRD